MARKHFWYYLTNEEGQPVDGAEITVTQAETSTTVYTYAAETGGTPSNTDPQTTTNSDGFFEFWVADKTSDISYGYSNIKLKVAWSKPGTIDDGYIDNIELSVHPHVYTEEITTGTWTALSGIYYIDIEHDLSNAYPLAAIYDTTQLNTVPCSAGIIDSTMTRVWSETDITCIVTLIG